MCWTGRWDTRDVREIDRRSPERRPVAEVRASDADRQATIDQLSRHTGEGRLTLEEFEARVDEAWHARTHRDLQHVLRELPVPSAPVARHHRRHLRAATLWVAIIVLAVVAIGPGSLWWLLPLAWFRFGGIGRHHHHHGRYERRHELSRNRDELTVV